MGLEDDDQAAGPLGHALPQAAEQGPDLGGVQALLAATSLPVVAAGGVSNLDDLVALAGLGAGGRRLSGAIVGKAVVEGRFSVEEGLVACAPSA